MANLHVITGHDEGNSGACGYVYTGAESVRALISNATDVNTFNTRMDDVKKGILDAFSIVSTLLVVIG